jgi:hypothetical protein
MNNTQKNIFIGIISVSLTFLQIWLAFVLSDKARGDAFALYYKGQEDLLDEKVDAIKSLNVYNQSVLDSFYDFRGETYNRFYFLSFLTEPYYQNFNILTRSNYECSENYIRLLGYMESMNSINRIILNVINQEVLIPTVDGLDKNQSDRDYSL